MTLTEPRTPPGDETDDRIEGEDVSKRKRATGCARSDQPGIGVYPRARWKHPWTFHQFWTSEGAAPKVTSATMPKRSATTWHKSVRLGVELQPLPVHQL